MLKGKSVIELTDVRTGKKEIYEDENLVTEAVADVLNTNLQGIMYDNPQLDGQSGDAWLLPVYSRLTGGILLYQDTIEEDPSVIYAPLNNPLVGYASNDVNTTEDVQRGQQKPDGKQSCGWRIQVCLGFCHFTGQRHHFCNLSHEYSCRKRMQICQ